MNTEQIKELLNRYFGEKIHPAISILKTQELYQNFANELIEATKEPTIEGVEELAKLFHDAYEEVAKKNNWNTQESCKVEFKDLPESNKQTMLDTCKIVLEHFQPKEQWISVEKEFDCDRCNDIPESEFPVLCNDCYSDLHGN